LVRRDVMKSVNSLCQSISELLNFICFLLFLIVNCLSRIGLNVGSISFSTFSKMNGNPELMQFSSALDSILSLRSQIHFPAQSALLLYIRSSHVRAWFWGSIMSGKRLLFSIMIPFCFDNSSLGRPSSSHPPILS